MQFTELVFSAPKKSGKTTLAAMIALYAAAQLAGQRGEIYCLANDFEQSQSRVFASINSIIEASPLLRSSAKITANKIIFKATGTTITAVANDYRGLAGINPSLTIYDETAYFVSESSKRLWDEGIPSPARKVSFRLSVSTAGFEGEPSPLRELYHRAMEFGVEVAPSTRAHENALVYWSHECRAPWQSQAWIAEMQRTLRAAQFKRLVQNQWVTSESTFVELAEWDKCVDPNARPVLSDRGLEVYAGLDLGLRHDSTALVTVARYGDRLRLVDHRIFIPSGKETLDIEATAEAAILELQGRFNLKGIAFDPWQAVYLTQRLKRTGVNCVEVAQSIPNLTAAVNTLLDLIKRQQIVLYPADDLRQAIAKPIAIESSRGWHLGKAKQSHRVDPVIAMAMAALTAMRTEQHHVQVSNFEDGHVYYDSDRARSPEWFMRPLEPGAVKPPNACAGCGGLLAAVGPHEVDGQRLCSECYFRRPELPLDFLRA